MSRYAAIDIGSNSIRLRVAEITPPEPPRLLLEDRQVVRLGEGVFRDGRLEPAAMELAASVLRRMVEEYTKLDVLAARAVGTAALRDASNRGEFLQVAEGILGSKVDVISGLEEARLIHLGVQTQWPHPDERVLLIDIGGGSAELILAEGGHVAEAFSKPIGAVRLTEMFLRSEPRDPRELARLEKYVQERLVNPAARFKDRKVDRAIATSATASALVCAINGIRRSRRQEADRMEASAEQIARLYAQLAELDLAGRREITGIGPRRAEIIVAGAAVMHLIMQELRLPRLYYSTSGATVGIIADLAHRKVGMEQARLDADQRSVVRAMVRRYGISPTHVSKVAGLANMLFDGLRALHQLPLERGRTLEAAAYLYNIGHYVNESRHHRHSLYLVMNSDLPGFTDQERLAIANLCRYHRKSLPQASHETFQSMAEEDRRAVTLLAPLLRVAVALDQSQEQKVERVETALHNGGVELRLVSNRDVDIEQWHTEKAGDVFQSVYGLPLHVRTIR